MHWTFRYASFTWHISSIILMSTMTMCSTSIYTASWHWKNRWLLFLCAPEGMYDNIAFFRLIWHVYFPWFWIISCRKRIKESSWDVTTSCWRIKEAILRWRANGATSFFNRGILVGWERTGCILFIRINTLSFWHHEIDLLVVHELFKGTIWIWQSIIQMTRI
jgi:hypothetical protein